ncbi:MAG: hypothetical protein K6T61_17855 [Bryobacteraceae bacterium]|nr:hypothetical protein [Bryobacteraceae bacterium]
MLSTMLVVHAAFATLLAMAPRWEGTPGQTKLGPIAEALHGKVKQPMPPRRRRQGARAEVDQQQGLPQASRRPASRQRQLQLRLVG